MIFEKQIKKAFTILLPLTLAACTTVNPATGKRDFTPFMSPSKEMSIGQEAHPGILKDNGGTYNDPRITQYVNDMGQRLVANSELSDYPFTFTVLDTPLVNAFALPGGYVYVTRGIMALVNDESELASVIGHEIGHVTARHSAKRYNNQMFAGLGTILVGAATGNSALANSVGQGAQAYLMSYSRDQEHQSDELGIRYASRAGFDPYAASSMLNGLDNEHKLQLTLANREGESRGTDFGSTHPNTQERVARAFQGATQTGIPQNSRNRNQEVYFNIIDGMRFGDDPKQGIIDGKEFKHPSMKFKFTVPDNYILQNSSQVVMARGTGTAEGAVIIFAGANMNGKSVRDHASELWQKYKIENAMQSLQDLDINGMAAATGYTTMSMNNQNYIVRLIAIQHSGNNGYHFLMLTPQSKYNSLSESLQRTSYTFNKLSDQEAAAIKGRKIRVIRAASGDSINSLSSRMAFDKYQKERFMAMNGLNDNSMIRAGQRLKLVVWE
ncbi:M48 family metalloprotease [Pseudemcibacter aquimaris]|uniref:M48 family metalloprotease n=1 Tax=Pseudemcibacter aquimaris TaxID=2857064 RepID=UPI00201326F5|nr:M48 family metalloprotease [Pseudemcibacter aquimaris]MCC3861581.1 M48 family metalloprotease [Pseudemcibacter aquimaris]WDU58350.1 M48 family metalloprotease [Pseudemcibacter aquimaris]